MEYKNESEKEMVIPVYGTVKLRRNGVMGCSLDIGGVWSMEDNDAVGARRGSPPRRPTVRLKKGRVDRRGGACLRRDSATVTATGLEHHLDVREGHARSPTEKAPG